LKNKRTAPGKSHHLVDRDPGAIIDSFSRSWVSQDNMETRRLRQNNNRAVSARLEPALRRRGRQRPAAEHLLPDVETTDNTAGVQEG
jgi:hypothetical protein